MTEKDDKQDGYISDIINAFKIPKEAFEPAYPSSWYVQQAVRRNQEYSNFTPQHIHNITVNAKFGGEIDHYLHKTYPQYNHHTDVVIIADCRMRSLEYLISNHNNLHSPYVDHTNIKSGHIEFKHYNAHGSEMFMAYAPEINTLFVRTLFDVIRTPDNPDDKMDIEARLGL